MNYKGNVSDVSQKKTGSKYTTAFQRLKTDQNMYEMYKIIHYSAISLFSTVKNWQFSYFYSQKPMLIYLIYVIWELLSDQ